jgi:hypothetical protein
MGGGEEVNVKHERPRVPALTGTHAGEIWGNVSWWKKGRKKIEEGNNWRIEKMYRYLDDEFYQDGM